MKGLETFARCWLIKVTPANQNHADLIRRQHGNNATTLWQKIIVYGCKSGQVASNGVTIRGDMVHFSGSGLLLSRCKHTQEKSGWVVPRLHDSIWRAKSGLIMVFGFRMKLTIHLAILWCEILTIDLQLNTVSFGKRYHCWWPYPDHLC